ncbi:hypothetical protein [Halothermothrix orenii]|uniref:Sporulation membrane protein YtrI C-terminal domain-containing protein n=1 Tax=Halothermothrix orenii (strain H 168 / OCM 544 / DSM 9562) TaxID=373903 RepID=B8D1J6_HALOH|nr:hypothetical protein [Halothermothrix orenii]ACL69073.1 hypothetical protein Hore_03120 [Halothermothrix orenii H 168]
MFYPIFSFTKGELIFILAVFILGTIVGATLLNIYLSRRIDNLILTNRELKIKNEEQQEQIDQLKENLKISRRHYINNVQIKLRSELNKHTQQDIIQKIKKLLSGLPGKEIKDIDALLIRDLINDRYLVIEDEVYRLELIYLVISEELTLYIKVSTKNGENN